MDSVKYIYKLLFLLSVIFAQNTAVNVQRCNLGSGQNRTVCGPDPNTNTVTEQQCQDRGCCYDTTSKECYIPKQDIDECSSNPCVNGGTCANKVDSYTCTCLEKYSGVNCQDGYSSSCLDIIKQGGTVTAYYNINFYHDILSSDCDMVQLPFPVSKEFSQYFPATERGKVRSISNQSLALCSQHCLNDSLCTVMRWDKKTLVCEIWSIDAQYYSITEALTGYAPSLQITPVTASVKHCPVATPVLCDLADPSFPVTHIQPVTDTFSIHYHKRHFSYKFTSRTLIHYSPITKRQLDYLRYVSHACSQWMKVTCRYTVPFYQGFLMADNKQYNLVSVYNGSCPCYLTDVCGANLVNKKCGCFTNKPDSGIIRKKELLPIQGILYGDVNESNENIKFNAGAMKCTQSKNEIDECESSNCQNGATCVDGHYAYTCDCVPGFTGVYCEEDIKDCVGVVCQNGGTCFDRVNKYICACNKGYSGTNCEINIDECASNPCHNEGSCVDEVNKFRCLCWSGTVGELCDKEVDDCISTPCQHGGTCTDLRNNYTCICPTGYGGRNCQQDIDDCANNPCNNGASCTDSLNDFVCTCAPGYTNTLCQTEIYECESSPCHNNGYCQDKIAGYTCACPPGFTGGHCETDMDECISNPCVHGTCQDTINSYVCKCQDGYLGWDCDQDYDECSSSPCSNGSTCVDQVNGFTCQCAQGYTGELCQIDINECSSSPCLNGGSCKDLVNGYQCNCIAGFTGNLCQLVMVDGQWGGWGPWTQCSVKCGTGVHTRTRSCNNPTPQNGGTTCEGEQAVAELCYSDTCADIDGKWGMWGSWGKCSQTCNYGTKVRQRICDTPPPKGEGQECEGTDTSTAVCKERDCGSPVDGGWSIWGAWVSCSTTCGVGTSSRTRQCNQPPPVYGGKQCQGLGTNWEPCYLSHCPSYGSCSPWAEWTACSTTCGDGQRKRQRTCQLNQDTVPSNATSVLQSTIEYEVQHCEDMPCQVMECYHCSSAYTGHAESLTCKGPTKQCSVEQKYCIYVFSKEKNQTLGLTKRCGGLGECTSEVEDQCKAIYDQTIDSIITDNQDQKGPLEPHPDTLAQMWDALVTQCKICCTATRCNRGLLPSGNTIYTGGSAQIRGESWIGLLAFVVAYLFARD